MKNPAVGLATLALLAGCGDSSAPTAQNYPKLEAPTHDCAAGANLSIETSNRTFTLKGLCDQIVIKGIGNRLTIAAAKNIEIFGDNNVVEVDEVARLRAHSKGNTIRYKSGIGGNPADVVTLGDNNPIHQVK